MQGGGWTRGEGAGPEQRQLQTQEQNETLQPPHQTNQTKPNQTKPNQTKPTKPNQTTPTKPNQTKPNQIMFQTIQKKKKKFRQIFLLYVKTSLTRSEQTDSCRCEHFKTLRSYFFTHLWTENNRVYFRISYIL